jgi:transposase
LLSKDNPYRYVGDHIYPQVQEADYAFLYPAEGQPAESPVDLMLVTVFQFLEDLPDRAAADAVRLRIDWKYALHLPLLDTGFNFSVLSEFRDRLLAHQAERRLFDQMLALLQQAGLLKKRGRQRSDSLSVLTKVRDLSRLEMVLETLRVAVRALVEADLAWARAHLPFSWEQQYGQRAIAYQLSDEQRAELEQTVGRDGFWLLDRLAADDTPAQLRALEAVHLLHTVWPQKFVRQAEGVSWRPGGHYEGPTEIHTPHDPEARWSAKRGQGTVGYRLQVTDTDDDGYPHLITDIALAPHTQADATALPAIQRRLAEREALPSVQITDTAYFSGANAQASAQQGIDLVSPAPADTSPQAHLPDGLTNDQFLFDWEKQRVTCPGGQVSRRWHEQAGAAEGEVVVQAVFAKAVCAACPLLKRCVVGTLKRDGRKVCRSSTWPALQAQRQRQHTPDFRQEYLRRGGVEGTLSVLVRQHGARSMRYLGTLKGHLQALFTGVAFNLKRATAWLAGHRPQPRRRGGLGLAAVRLDTG